jgi:hypothetical protein
MDFKNLEPRFLKVSSSLDFTIQFPLKINTNMLPYSCTKRLTMALLLKLSEEEV